MRDVSCPTCSAPRTRLFFREGETDAAGFRCALCGCVFIVLKEGRIPEDDDDEEEHARDVWPY